MKSRQLKWQNKKQEEGKCRICGKSATDKFSCLEHLKKHRTRMRNRYRKKHGIKLDAPIKNGRPIKYTGDKDVPD